MAKRSRKNDRKGFSLSRSLSQANRGAKVGQPRGRVLRVELLEVRELLSANGFSQNDLVVERFGDGSAALSNASTAAFLDEYTTSAGQTSPVNTLALPTTPGTGTQPNPLTVTGNSTTEGQLTRSADGKYLLVPGYNTTTGLASLPGTVGTTIAREVGRIDGNAGIDTTTTTTDYSTGNIRGATSSDGNQIWTVGSNTGVGTQTLGASGSTTIVSNSNSTNNRSIQIFNGQLYEMSGAGTRGLYVVGSGLPTSTGTTSTLLIGTGSSSSPEAFWVSPDGKTVYIADQSATASGGGIQKYTSPTGATGSFTLAYTLGTGTGSTVGALGLVVDNSSANPVIYATTNESNANRLIKIVDGGSVALSTVTTVATALPNTAFRGVAFAPYTAGTTVLDILPANLSQPEGNSGTTNFTFTVRRTGDVTGAAGANWAVTGSGANPANAADFVGSVLPSGSVSFAAGQTTATVTVPVKGDVTVEPNETFSVTLSGPSGVGVSLGSQSVATGTIVDDDSVPNYVIAANQTALPEGDTGDITPFTFTVTRSVLTTGSSSVDWAVTGTGAHPANAADFDGGVLPSGTVNFTAGQTSAQITVNVAGDITVENDEDFTVTLSNPQPNGAINTASATSTITNDDTGVFITTDQSSKAEGNSGATPFTFTVTRSGVLTGTSDLTWSVSGSGANPADASDFVGNAFPSGSLHFNAGDTTQTITVNLQGDTAFEPDEGFTVSLANNIGTQIQGQGMVSTTILNDDFQALNPGDIVITGINASGTDEFSFVPLVALLPNSPIIFTDNAWTGTALTTNEGNVTYTAPAGGLAAGTKVVIDSTDGVIVAGDGTVTPPSNFSLATAGDNIFAYTGLSTAPNFLYAVTTSNPYDTSGPTSTNDTYLPSTLTAGTTAVQALGPPAGNVANAEYNNSVISGTPAAIRAAVGLAANWTPSDTGISLDPTNFTVTAPTSTGDYNGDHVVNAADYTVWRDHLGQTVTPFSGADGDGSGVIDQGDYTFWKNHFGNVVPGAGSGAGTVAAAQLQEVAPAAVVTQTLVDSSNSSGSTATGGTTGTAHDQVLAAFAPPSAAPVFEHHAANNGAGSGDAEGFRTAWLRDLLLSQTSGGKSDGTSTTTKHGDSTGESGDTDATDECFATLGSGPSAGLL
jgi:hypothetical protein